MLDPGAPARPRVARRHGGGEQPGRGLQQRGRGRRRGAPAPPGWSGGRRARCGRPGSRCTRRRRWRGARRPRGRRRAAWSASPASPCAARSGPVVAGPARERAEELGGLLGDAADRLVGVARVVGAAHGSARRAPGCARPGPANRDLQLALAPPGRRPPGAGPGPAGSVRSRRYDPTVTTSSSPLRARSTSARVTSGSARRSTRPGAVRVDPERARRPSGTASGSAPSYTLARPGRAAPSTPDRLGGPVDRAPQRQPGERLGRPRPSTSSWATTQPARQSSAPLGGEDPVGHDAVDAVAEQRQRRVRPAGLGQHDGLGREHEPDAGVGPGEQRADLVELGVQPLDGVEDAAARHRDAGGPGQHRPQRLDHAPLRPGRRAACTSPSASGSASSRSVSAVGCAVDDDDVPLVRTARAAAARAAPAPPRRRG